jgi:hypothetical protein
MAIAATGRAMVSMVEHASGATPVPCRQVRSLPVALHIGTTDVPVSPTTN